MHFKMIGSSNCPIRAVYVPITFEEIVIMITLWIVLHSVQLLLLIIKNWIIG